MPSANRPMISSGWREFLRVIRLSSASTAASAPRPATHSAATSGTPSIDDAADDHPGQKRADGEDDAGDQRDEIAAHPRPEDAAHATARP